MIAKIILILIIIFSLISCKSDETSLRTLRFAHFWTEPHQQRIIDSLIDVFEQKNPTIQIEQIPLQWKEGRTKLLLAHSSTEVPDITHIGIEWAQEFIEAQIFSPISSNPYIPEQFLSAIKGKDGNVYCLPWTMNTRALVITHSLSQIGDSLSWEQILNHEPNNPIFGINATEKHNVTKRILPILWSNGSKLFQSLPFSNTCDQELIEGLGLLRKVMSRGIIEQSRLLDQYVIQGKIQATLTGQWILPDLQNIPHTVLNSIPGKSGRSILSGDCLGIAQNSKFQKEALLFIQFITKYERTKDLCMNIPDAGLPAHKHSFIDDDFLRNTDRLGFLRQCKHSVILPTPSYYLDAEEILEDHIMQFIYGKIDERLFLASLKMSFEQLETKKKGS
jgi:ABC-type glycerol-3-phosphate transport system substrate-binding protein